MLHAGIVNKNVCYRKQIARHQGPAPAQCRTKSQRVCGFAK